MKQIISLLSISLLRAPPKADTFVLSTLNQITQ